MDPETQRWWELSLADPSALIVFEDMLKLLDGRWRAIERSPNPNASQLSKAKLVKASSKTTLVASSESSRECVLCSANHELNDCVKFKALNLDQRKEKVISNNLCFKCLRAGHSAVRCSSSRCAKCRGRHHLLLHSEELHNQRSSKGSTSTAEKPKSTTTATAGEPSSSANISTLHSRGNSQVVLSTAIVHKDEHGHVQKIRALLDSGSEVTFITEECAQRLRLRRRPGYVNISGVGKTDAGCTRGAVTLAMESIVDPSFKLSVTALILKKLTNLVPRIELDNRSWPQFSGITLADPDYYQPGRVDLLIGADVFGTLLADGLIPSSNKSPIAQNTRLGWILMGETIVTNVTSISCNTSIIDDHRNLEDILKSFWEVENREPKTTILSADEQACEDHFLQTHSRDSTGRFVVRLPLTNNVHLGESRGIALKRFNSTERRLAAQPELKKQYVDFMREYSMLNHMVPVRNPPPSAHFYLPHHGVIKQSSSTTKLRVVFDASCKTTSGLSLNDMQYVGPRLQDNLFDTVLRFRMHRVALSADITKMYRQILVHPDDQDFQRILWREESSAVVEEYCLKTVTYGTASAPYLAVRALRQLAVIEQHNFPAASNAILSSFYVDDLISGSEDINKAIQLRDDLMEVLKRGGFELRKWSSNCPEVIQDLSAELRESQSPLAISDEEVVGTLGILWYPNIDQFGFVVRDTKNEIRISKRQILSEIARIFDPLGWLSPTIIVGKIIMQELWLLGLDWDEQVPPSMLERWSTYRDGLSALQNIRIPRWLQVSSSTTITLHGFCDASEKAIAAVVYLVATSEFGTTTSTLVTAKTRVAPVKTISIPRLELCGAQMLAKLICYVKCTLALKEEVKFIAWTDSTIVLAWLQRLPSTLKTFVANRVSDIQTRISPSLWRHVRSEENPADCGSRGVDPEILASHDLWWHGPLWLTKGEMCWPTSLTTITPKQVPELKAAEVSSLHTSNNIIEWELLSRYSSYFRLTRITAHLLRFITNLNRPIAERCTGQLWSAELNDAQMFWFKHVQRANFTAELKCCLAGNNVPSSSKLVGLNPFLDKDGVLRVGGRLKNAKLNRDQTNPIILPANSFLINLLVSDAHLRLFHAGVQLTLSHLRRKFWIIGCRRTVSKYIRRCVICCRQKGATSQQLMGNLPPQRVQPCRPFLRSGVDYAGPFVLRMSKGRGCRSLVKGYIALFVCLVTKALHLELVGDLTTDGFLAAFRRFVARRGICKELWSDNGTNFVGAKKELTRVLKDERLRRDLVYNGTDWHMIPAGSPHQGGLWEAGVKSVKHHLRRVLKDTILTYEEFNTIIIQVEGCLNSRPLCQVTDNHSDIEALTPAHFLIGESLVSVPEVDLTEVQPGRLKRWHLIQQIQQHFWKRWQLEYISTLQTRNKWKKPQINLKVDDIVIMKDENLPPAKWNLGRIIECHSGTDGYVRSATVKYHGGTTKRAVQKLCLLPLD